MVQEVGGVGAEVQLRRSEKVKVLMSDVLTALSPGPYTDVAPHIAEGPGSGSGKRVDVEP